MATSLDALEALLQFREGSASKRSRPLMRSHIIYPAMPVPNPLDPTQPHLIEGDAPTPIVHRHAFWSGEKSAVSPKQPAHADAPVVSTVPNPLDTPIVEKCPSRHHLPPVTDVKPSAPLSSQIKVVTHGFAVNPTAAPTPTPTTSGAKPSEQPLEVEIRTDIILDALNSKPQRGKKRRNLNDLERLELTRTRNREHAKCTRSKKKARLQELLDIEKEYLLLRENEVLVVRRKQRLAEFVETAWKDRPEVKACDHSSSLSELASQVIQKAQFSVTDSVALTSEHTGMARVSARGTDLESGQPKTLTGVIDVDFTPGTADISDVSLYWASPESTTSPVGMVPSISVLSFDTPDQSSSSRF